MRRTSHHLCHHLGHAAAHPAHPAHPRWHAAHPRRTAVAAELELGSAGHSAAAAAAPAAHAAHLTEEDREGILAAEELREDLLGPLVGEAAAAAARAIEALLAELVIRTTLLLTAEAFVRLGDLLKVLLGELLVLGVLIWVVLDRKLLVRLQNERGAGGGHWNEPTATGRLERGRVDCRRAGRGVGTRVALVTYSHNAANPSPSTQLAARVTGRLGNTVATSCAKTLSHAHERS